MVKKVNHKELKEDLMHYCEKDAGAVFVSGPVGVGKSQICKEVAMTRSNNLNREFFHWNKRSKAEKDMLAENPETVKKYFIFADIRLTLADPTDLKGVPFATNKGWVDWRSDKLFTILSYPGVEGLIFFDEMNLAAPSVQASSYQIVLDKAIGELSLNPAVRIIAAGNRPEDKCGVMEMKAALDNRFAHIELKVPTTEEWTQWAIEAGIDTRIISYLAFNPVLYQADSKTKSKAFATPRSWATCSPAIIGDENIPRVCRRVAYHVGEQISSEMEAFLRYTVGIKVKDLIDKPASVKTVTKSIDMKYAVVSAVANHYKQHRKDLGAIIDIASHLEPEFGRLMLRMCKAMDGAKDGEDWKELAKIPNWEQKLKIIVDILK